MEPANKASTSAGGSGKGGSGPGGAETRKMPGVIYRTLAIDLGTHTSLGAYYRGNNLINIRGETIQSRTFPSVVAFCLDGTVLVGEKAKEYGLYHPENTITNVKRLIGRKFDKVAKDLTDKIGYKIEKAENGDCLIVVKDGNGVESKYTPETISSLILKKVKLEAERQNANTVFQNAVITVPAYFNDAQRQATIQAAEMANLHVIRLINEPTGASLRYGDTMDDDTKANLLVFDLGGGTFDVSVVNIVKDAEGKTTYRVRGVAGINFLGGIDIDYTINRFVTANLRSKKKYFYDYYHAQFKKKKEEEAEKENKKNKNVQIANQSADDEKKEAEKAQEGTEVNETNRSIVQVTPEILASIDQKIRIFAEKKKIDLCSDPAGEVEIEISDLVPGLHFKETLTMASFEALNQCTLLSIKEQLDVVLDTCKMTKADVTDVLLVGGSTNVPCVKKLVKTYFNDKEPVTLSPQEDVVSGAAMYSACYDGNRLFANLVLKDATAFNIGIKDKDDKMIVIVPRSTNLPFDNKDNPHIIFTAEKEQKDARLMIFEGNNTFVKHNAKLGEFCLENMRTRKGERTSIQIRVHISEKTGVIKVTANDEFKTAEQVAYFDKAVGYGYSKEKEEEMRRVTQSLNQSLADDYQRSIIKNELHAFCIKYGQELESAPKENVEGFDLRRQKFKRFANETINWLHGPLGKRIKLEDITTKTQELTQFYECTLKNEDWEEPDDTDQLNAALYGKGEAKVDTYPTVVNPSPVAVDMNILQNLKQEPNAENEDYENETTTRNDQDSCSASSESDSEDEHKARYDKFLNLCTKEDKQGENEEDYETDDSSSIDSENVPDESDSDEDEETASDTTVKL